ncbi:DNA ligase I [Flagelloscypha sp. PMI_526]|nr:DNA ligase I [Flagelloscypha sp. PMI_526]
MYGCCMLLGRVHHWRFLLGPVYMRRQQTLGKFFEMPKSMKPAPPQQSSLTAMWGKKSASTTSTSRPDAMEVDSTVNEPTAVPTPEEKLQATSSNKPQTKRRRVIDSDEEDSDTSPSKDAPVSTTPPPKKRPRKSTSPTRSKPAARAPSPASSIVDGDQSEGESEAELDEVNPEVVAKSPANTKIAEAALQRVEDVDIPEGWKTGASIPYAALAKTFGLIESTTKRLEKTAILTAFLFLVIQRSTPGNHDPLLQAVYLCINRLCPDYEGIELGIGESLLIKAIGESTGRSVAKIKEDLKKEGDLGLVAMSSRQTQKTMFKPKPLVLDSVFKDLKAIALTTGHASQDKKVKTITKLLAACQGVEAKYIIRSLEGKLRIGNAERSVLVALAQAAVLSESEKAEKKWNKEKLASRQLPSYDLVIPALLTYGIQGVNDHCSMTPGVPLKPMLAKPTKAIGEVLDRFENKRFTCEYKYDGERAQVHRTEDGKVHVFSRNSEDMSKKYPDLVEQLPHYSVKSFVLDAEAVAIDRTNFKLMPFQELSKRKRKDVKIEDIQVRVCLFGFDLLYLNGEPLLHKTLDERRKLLRAHFNVVPGEFDFAKSSDSQATEDIETFLNESVKDGCEGLMVKMLESEASHYEPSRRSVNWLKVLGARGLNVYGAFLLACYDPDAEEFQTICKIGTGFSEEMLQSHYDLLKPLESSQPRSDIKVGGAKPDIWFEPKVVWEVLAADLSLSPIYMAAQGLVEERGISLRFPRFIRIRDDKDADDATNGEQVCNFPNFVFLDFDPD